MGAWGVKLYQDDVAVDTRDSYRDMLREQENCTDEELTAKFIEQNADYTDDTEDGPVFWMALADMQWKYGRLEEYVKQKALECIRDGSDIERWLAESPKDAKKRSVELLALEEKLLSPQPPRKKFPKPNTYVCPWRIGDVYAYQFHTEFAKENGYDSRYIYLIKAYDDTFGNAKYPRFYVYSGTSDALLSLEQVQEKEYLPQFFRQSVFGKFPDKPRLYAIELQFTSARIVPKQYLHFIGHIDELPRPQNESSNDYYGVMWKNFEEYHINHFKEWGVY